MIPIISFTVDHHLSNGSIVQFHITNILVHMAATCFLYLFLAGIIKTDTGAKAVRFIEPRFFCLFITALWALHPIQTNCVTYIVQRMAAMAALFYLAALAFYIRARISKTPLAKISLFSAAFIACALAFMSKENAFTLPAAIAMVELIFISPDLAKKNLRSMKRRHWLILVIVILLLLPLGENYWGGVLNGYNMRHFTLTERLLTELRIVVFYISLLLIPLPHRLNLDHHVAVSHSLFSPVTTLLCLLVLVSLFIFAIRTRKTNPFITFGVLWFFLNLIIESSVIPLELIF
ncbi:MAG: hypothetical protein KAJ45_07810, partial [Desulfobulbaceae bacterium]|nr:hypothetical protein [Desulfobulbaceae bacterium]